MIVRNDGIDHWRWRLFVKFRDSKESMEKFEARVCDDPELLVWMLLWLRAEDVRRVF